MNYDSSIVVFYIMKRKYIICYLFTLLILCGCRDRAKENPLAFIPPIFPDEIKITPVIFDEEYIMSPIIDLYISDTIIFARSTDANGRTVQIIDVCNGEKISSMIPSGRGPGSSYLPLTSPL